MQDLLDKFGIQISKGGLRAGMTNSVGAIDCGMSHLTRRELIRQ